MGIQQFLLVLGKGQLSPFWVVARPKQAVDGGRFRTAQLTEPFGRPTSGGCQGGFQTHGLEQAQNPPQRGGLAGTWPTSEQHELHSSGQLYRLPLLFRVLHPLLLLHLSHQFRDALRRMQLLLAHFSDPPSNILLRFI